MVGKYFLLTISQQSIHGAGYLAMKDIEHTAIIGSWSKLVRHNLFTS
jgi:hypothetical protein